VHFINRTLLVSLLVCFGLLNAQPGNKAHILKTLSSAGYDQKIILQAMEKPISDGTVLTLKNLAQGNFSNTFSKKIIAQDLSLSQKQINELLDLKMSGIEEALILLTLPVSPKKNDALKSRNKPIVLVLDFKNDTRLDHVSLGSGIADMMSTALLENGSFRLVERGETLRLILEEHALVQSGLVTGANAARIGQLLGATHVITGKVTEFGIRKKSASVGFILGGAGKKTITSRVVMDARLVDVSTGEAVKAGTGTGEITTEVSAGVALPVSMEIGTLGFDETTIGQATRQAINLVVQKISTVK